MNAIFLALQAPDFDVGRWLGPLLKYAAIFFLIVLPIIRSIVEAARKSREKAPDADVATRRASADEARRRWEELMRGGDAAEAEPAEAQPPPPPPPPSVPRVPAPLAPTPAPLASAPAPLARGRDDELARRGLEDEHAFETRSDEEAREDEEAAALRAIEARDRAERLRRRALVEADRAAATSHRGTVGTIEGPTFELEVGDASGAATPAAPSSPRAGLRLSGRRELRRAVIASEILGSPLGLRGAGAASAFDRPR